MKFSIIVLMTSCEPNRALRIPGIAPHIPPTATAVADQILKGLQQVTIAGHHPVVLASPTVRAVVRQIIEPHMASASVLGYNEIVQGVEVESLALVGLPPTPSANNARAAQEAAA